MTTGRRAAKDAHEGHARAAGPGRGEARELLQAQSL